MLNIAIIAFDNTATYLRPLNVPGVSSVVPLSTRTLKI